MITCIKRITTSSLPAKTVINRQQRRAILSRVTTIGVLALVFSLTVNAQLNTPAPGNQMQRHVRVEARSVGETASLGGSVAPYREVTLTAQVPGKVLEIAGREGEWFQENAVLVRIDDSGILAQQRAAVAEMQNAQAALHNAGVQYSRELLAPQSRNINRSPGMGLPSLFDQFFTRNMGSMFGYSNPRVERYSDLYQQRTMVSQGQARMMQAQSKLDEINVRLRDTLSIAPFEGVISRKLVEVGDTIQPGQPLLVFSDISYLQVIVDVPGSLAPGLHVGDLVKITLDDLNRTEVDGKVVQKFPVADPQRHTITVKIDLPEGAPAGAGMYAEVSIPDPTSPVRKLPVIPSSAIIPRGSLPAVYVVNPQSGLNELRYLRLGPEVGEDQVSVLAGLQDGEIIVVEETVRPSFQGYR